MITHNLLEDPRFAGIEPFESKVWLASPTMHGEEQFWVDDAIRKNWVSTVGENINEIEKQIADNRKKKQQQQNGQSANQQNGSGSGYDNGYGEYGNEADAYNNWLGYDQYGNGYDNTYGSAYDWSNPWGY